LINEEKADLKIETTVYPKYETKGDLPACVGNFRQWYVVELMATTATALLQPGMYRDRKFH